VAILETESLTIESSKYFSKVIEQQRRTTETKIVEMAKERWIEVRNTANIEK
jgi:hypothetical protein